MKTPGPIATVIGGHGFVGRHLIAALCAQGWECRVPQRDDAELLGRELGQIFYCAGLTADYAQRPFDTVEAHASLLSRVLKHARFESLVYLSSTRLYDGISGGVATEDLSLPFNSDNPRHIYDLSKALGESLCRVAGGGRARVARLSCVWKDQTDEDGFLPALMKQVMVARRDTQEAMIEVDSSPFYARDYVHLDDVISALIHISRAPEGSELIYNVASGENLANGDLFDSLSGLSGCRIQAMRSDKPAVQAATVSIERMRRSFGWVPASVKSKLSELIGGDDRAATRR